MDSNSDSAQSYKDFREELQTEQKEMSYEDIKHQMLRSSKGVVELDRLSTQEHNWIDRGTVMSCEGAAHPHHQAFKRRR